MAKVKPQCTCKSFHGDNRECPWHGVEAMREYHRQAPALEMPGDYE